MTHTANDFYISRNRGGKVSFRSSDTSKHYALMNDCKKVGGVGVSDGADNTFFSASSLNTILAHLASTGWVKI